MSFTYLFDALNGFMIFFVLKSLLYTLQKMVKNFTIKNIINLIIIKLLLLFSFEAPIKDN